MDDEQWRIGSFSGRRTDLHLQPSRMDVGRIGRRFCEQEGEPEGVCVRALHGIEEMMAIMDKILKIA